MLILAAVSSVDPKNTETMLLTRQADMAPATPDPGPVTVFYDGACPLCRREIGLYRSSDGADAIAWVDVAADEACGRMPGLTRRDALARFHVRNADGDLVSGAAAFATLWLALPRWRWLGWIVMRPGIRHVAELLYRAFLVIRPAIQRRVRRIPAP